MGQQDGVELARVERERDPVADRFVRAALEHPAVDEDPGPLGVEQELRAGDGRRATEEVDLHGAHGDSAAGPCRRVSSGPHGHRGGRAVVRRAAGGPRRPRRRAEPRRAGRPGARVDAGAGAPLSGAAARASMARWPALDRRRDSAARTRGRSPTCAAPSTGSTSWSRRPGARPIRGRRSPTRTRRSRALGRALYRRYGEAAATRPGRRRDPRPADGPGPPRDRTGRRPRAGRCSRRSRRSGGSSTATAATRARIGASCARAPSAGRRHGSPIEANAVAARAAAGLARGDAPRRSWPPGGRSLGPGRLEPWDYRYAVGAAARRLDRARRRWTGCSTSTSDYLAALGADPDGLGIRYDVLPRPGRPLDPGRVHDRDGRLGGRPAGDRAVDAAAAVGLRDVRGGRPRQPRSSCSTRAAMPSTSAAIRTRPAFLDWTDGDTGVPRGHRGRPRLGRRRAGLAAALAGRGRRAARGAPRPVWRGDARHLLGAVRDRAPPPPRPPPERRLDRDHRRRPRASSRTRSGRGGRSAASSSTCPGYLANYALSAIMAAAVRARIREVRGPWCDGRSGLVSRSCRSALFAPGRRGRRRTCSRRSSAGR